MVASVKMASSPYQRLVLAVLLSSTIMTQAFYLPGVAPRAFKDGEHVSIKVQTIRFFRCKERKSQVMNSYALDPDADEPQLMSTETPLQFDYYQLPFCKPDLIHDLPENLGEALAGEKAHTSAYEARMKVNEYCNVLCRKKYTAKEMEEFQDFAILDYRVNMRLDSLPVAEMTTFAYEENPEETMEVYNLGYPVGAKMERSPESTEDDKWVLNNHLRFKILYHPFDSNDDDSLDLSERTGNFIVGFQVVPYSVTHTYKPPFNESAVPYVPLTSCNAKKGDVSPSKPMVINADQGLEVIWTYDVEWQRSPVKWASRWDVYLSMKDDNIHWFSIINSLVILVFLTGIVGLIMARILRKDFAKYNEMLTEQDREEQNREIREETGWKLVYADVFRPPPHATLLSVYAGSGMQLLVMCLLTLLFAALGFLSPANRGALLSSVMFFFVLMGVPAGYVSARYCKLVQEPNQFKTTLLTAILFPGVSFFMFFFINTIAWVKQSSTAVPFGTLVVLMLLWFGVSLPLIFFGAYLGFKRDVMPIPVIVSAVPRIIPPQPFYLNLWVSVIVGGLLPFGAVFVEMFFILSSIWQHRFYYMFGFLGLVFVILLVTCSEMTIVLCYLHLCAEDYRWWWRSFLTSGSTAIYVFMYAASHYFSRTHPSATYDSLAATVFFGYIFIICYALFVMTGFIGFSACFIFLKKIYSSIKID